MRCRSRLRARTRVRSYSAILRGCVSVCENDEGIERVQHQIQRSQYGSIHDRYTLRVLMHGSVQHIPHSGNTCSSPTHFNRNKASDHNISKTSLIRRLFILIIA